jgi:hypothetical protein
VLIDGPRPNRLSVRETRSPLDEKPTEDAETSMRVLDEQETETAVWGQQRNDTPLRSPLAGLRGAFLLKGGSTGLYRFTPLMPFKK